MLPGARGCTPQACAFRDHASQLGALGVRQLFGVSTQSVSDQTEAAERLHLLFALLSDEQLELAEAMRLLTMTVERCVLLRRLTLIAQERRVVAAF